MRLRLYFRLLLSLTKLRDLLTEWQYYIIYYLYAGSRLCWATSKTKKCHLYLTLLQSLWAKKENQIKQSCFAPKLCYNLKQNKILCENVCAICFIQCASKACNNTLLSSKLLPCILSFQKSLFYFFVMCERLSKSIFCT